MPVPTSVTKWGSCLSCDGFVASRPSRTAPTGDELLGRELLRLKHRGTNPTSRQQVLKRRNRLARRRKNHLAALGNGIIVRKRTNYRSQPFQTPRAKSAREAPTLIHRCQSGRNTGILERATGVRTSELKKPCRSGPPRLPSVLLTHSDPSPGSIFYNNHTLPNRHPFSIEVHNEPAYHARP